MVEGRESAASGGDWRTEPTYCSVWWLHPNGQVLLSTLTAEAHGGRRKCEGHGGTGAVVDAVLLEETVGGERLTGSRRSSSTGVSGEDDC